MMMEFYKFKCFKPYSEVMHLVSNKSQEYPYAFSLALHTGQQREKILENRQMLSSFLSTKKELTFVVANQTHSDHIKVIRDVDTLGWENLENAVENCDALITNKKGVVLTILTADCVPVLLYDRKKQVVGAVHAGWKGTKAKIVLKTIHAMQTEYGSNSEDIVAGIAPSIGRCCYEVEKDVAQHFFDTPWCFDKIDKKYMLDLPLINKQQLLDAGVKEDNIEMSSVCTACNVNSYFSYRKENGCDGRFMSLIGLK